MNKEEQEMANAIADLLEEDGRQYQAKYIRKYGTKRIPVWVTGPQKNREALFKAQLEKGKPFPRLNEYPDKVVL